MPLHTINFILLQQYPNPARPCWAMLGHAGPLLTIKAALPGTDGMSIRMGRMGWRSLAAPASSICPCSMMESHKLQMLHIWVEFLRLVEFFTLLSFFRALPWKIYGNFGMVIYWIYGCVWKCCVPHCTQWFSWSLSLWKMAISLGILTQHFQTNPYGIFMDIYHHLSSTTSKCW